MRVIAGILGGRQFASPHGHRTHPMSDKMRGALFNMLGDIDGVRILDAFAGTGALSIEAISRGAAEAIAIERDHRAQQTIDSNIDSLGLSDQVLLAKATVNGWLNKNPDVFALVLLDPPYDSIHTTLLNRVAERVAPDGRLVLSWPGNENPLQFAGLTLVKSKNYGDGSLHLYHKD